MRDSTTLFAYPFTLRSENGTIIAEGYIFDISEHLTGEQLSAKISRSDTVQYEDAVPEWSLE